MRARFVAVAVGFVACCFWSCRSAAPPALRSDPSEVVAALVHAFNNLDAGELRSLFAEDATAFLPFPTAGRRVNGREAIMRVIEPMFAAERARSSHAAPYLTLTARDPKVQRIARDAAIVTFDVGNEQVFSRRTVIVQASGRGWEIVHLHASNVRAELVAASSAQ